MALGEAFVNVRADLRPFDRDLDSGIKRILRETEARIASSNFGRAIGNRVAKETEEGLRRGTSKGLEEGLDDGFRRGAKKAVATAQDFLATLGNFVDDGLSAVPPKVKAAIVLGVAAAATVVAPLIGGALSSGISLGIGGGLIALGIAVAARLQVVQQRFQAVGERAVGALTRASEPLIKPLLRAADLIDSTFAKAGDQLQSIFGQLGYYIEPLVKGVLGLLAALVPAMLQVATALAPLIDSLSSDLPRIGRELAIGLHFIAISTPEATLAFHDLLLIFGGLASGALALIAVLAKLYFIIRVVSEVGRLNFAGAMQLIEDNTNRANKAAGRLEEGLGGVDTTLGNTANEAYAAKRAISDLTSQMLGALDAAIDYEAAYDALQESIKKGNTNFDIQNAKGRENVQTVEKLITAAATQRDKAIADSQRTGESIDTINKRYQEQITAVEKLIGKNGLQNKAIQDIINTAHQLPSQVAIEVTTPGAADAIARFRKLGSAIAAAAAAGANSGTGAGMKTATQKGGYALGGIITSPTTALIGEAGYSEAVIPDPSRMPQRAMQLSDAFGLTALISQNLGRDRSSVNVYIGSQRLAEMIDYRVAANDQRQATNLAYGYR